MKPCFEFRLDGRGKRRGFIHIACGSCEMRDGTTSFTLEDRLRVLVPEGDLAQQDCVVCEQPMLALTIP